MPKLRFTPEVSPQPSFTLTPDVISKITARVETEVTKQAMAGMLPVSVEVTPTPTGGVEIQVRPKPQTSAAKDDTEIVQEVMSQMFKPAKMQYDKLVKDAVREALKDLPSIMREGGNG